MIFYNQYQRPSNLINIRLSGYMNYKFDSPQVTIRIGKVENNSRTRSGTIKILLVNMDSQYARLSRNWDCIADFTLKPLSGSCYYENVSRTLEMKNDVSYRWLMLVALELDGPRYLISDYEAFTRPVQYKIAKKKTFSRSLKDGLSYGAGIGLAVLGAFNDNADYIYPAFQYN